MKEIFSDEAIAKMEPINKGWSSDKKYYIETQDGEKLLLRVADISEYDRKLREFDIIRRISTLGINMSQPVNFGTCCEGKSVYQLLTWCEGEEALVLLPSMTDEDQYVLGLKAGEILRRIHTLDVSLPSLEWARAYDKKIDHYVEAYKNCGLTFERDVFFLDFINKNRGLLKDKPFSTCLCHGDFHAGNFVISPEKELYVIDFQRCKTTTPYYAFHSILFSADVSPKFATGQVHGYFGGDPPDDFGDCLCLFLAVLSVHAFPWSVPFGQQEIDFAHHMSEKILDWYDGFTRTVPTWYASE